MESTLELNASNMMTSVSTNDSDADRSKKRLKTNKSDENQNSNKPDVFRIPHSRMRELVNSPLAEAASVPDVQDLQPSLQAVYEAMWELKSHEIIENEYIMDTLKARLQARQVFNEAVCNCHEDSVLLEVIGLVEKVYMANTQKERCMYGQKLQRAIRNFLDDFIHHMEQEEATFQPLLAEHFDDTELEAMNKTVTEQHAIYKEKIKTEKSLKAVKRKLSDEVFKQDDFGLDTLRFKKSYCQEVKERKETKKEDQAVLEVIKSEVSIQDILTKDKATISQCEGDRREKSVTEALALAKQNEKELSSAELIPQEILMTLFAHLSPKELISCSAVCRSWREVALSPTLWQAIYPTQWARGNWSFDYDTPDLDRDLKSLESSTESLISNSSTADDSSSESATERRGSSASSNITVFSSTSHKEDYMFKGIINNLLPMVGHSVSTLILSASRGLTSQHVRGMLKQVLNVRYVDLSYTNVTADGFKGLSRFGALRKLEGLNLAGCKFVSDSLLYHLGKCYVDSNTRRSFTSHLSRLTLSGCRCITSLGVQHLEIHQSSLIELDLSGCYRVDGETLTMFVRECSKLKPQKLSYCNDIEDGPYQDTANGCLNLECEARFCCQNSKFSF